MSEIEILENLKKYLQFLLDNGTHKIFYNDLFWSEKTIDCINAINDLQQENKQLKSILTELEEEINLIIQHYKELRKRPFEDSVFKNNMLRQSFIISIEGYFQNLLDTIQELKEKYK